MLHFPGRRTQNDLTPKIISARLLLEKYMVRGRLHYLLPPVTRSTATLLYHTAHPLIVWGPCRYAFLTSNRLNYSCPASETPSAGDAEASAGAKGGEELAGFHSSSPHPPADPVAISASDGELQGRCFLWSTSPSIDSWWAGRGAPAAMLPQGISKWQAVLLGRYKACPQTNTDTRETLPSVTNKAPESLNVQRKLCSSSLLGKSVRRGGWGKACWSLGSAVLFIFIPLFPCAHFFRPSHFPAELCHH